MSLRTFGDHYLHRRNDNIRLELNTILKGALRRSFLFITPIYKQDIDLPKLSLYNINRVKYPIYERQRASIFMMGALFCINSPFIRILYYSDYKRR